VRNEAPVRHPGFGGVPGHGLRPLEKAYGAAGMRTDLARRGFFMNWDWDRIFPRFPQLDRGIS
jgi:hypothetical protein